MAFEPRLNFLRDNGNGTYSAQGITFNLQSVSNADGLRSRTAQALDAGFTAAANSPGGAMQQILGSLSAMAAKTPGGQVVTFYSDPAAFYAGTPNDPKLFSTHPTLGVQGIATWRDNPVGGTSVQNGNSGLVEDRTELRIWINPQGGGSAVSLPDGTLGLNYRSLPNLVWHELGGHGLDTKQHAGQPPAAATSDPWIQKMQALGREFAPRLFDPVTQQNLDLISPGQWTMGGAVTTFASNNSSQLGDIYDPTGKLDLTTVVFTDGHKEVVDYDQANASVWSTITKTYDAAGRLDTQSTLNDNGTRIDVDYDQANAFATVASTTTAYDAQNHVDWTNEIYDAAAGGGRTVTDYDQANTSATIASTTTRYDAQNHVDWTDTAFDASAGGGRKVVDQDQDGSQVWSQFVTRYDAQKRVDWTDQVYDVTAGGGHTVTDYDQANASATVAFTATRYDSGDNQTWQQVMLDGSGGHTDTAWDRAGQQYWDKWVNVFDGQEHQTWQSVVLDGSGGHTDTAWDRAGQQYWDKWVNVFDGQERQTWQQTVLDGSGGHTDTAWDRAGQQYWDKWVNVFDGQERQTWQQTVLDGSGGRTETAWDRAGQQYWDKWVNVYDGQEHQTWQQTVLDGGGGRTETAWDWAGQQTWWSQVDVYNGAGNETWQQIVLDGIGGRTETAWDWAGQQTWWSQIDIYDGQGRQDWQQIVNDGGARVEADWDLANNLWYSSFVVNYDSSGNADFASGSVDQGSWAGGMSYRDWDQLNQHNFANPRTGTYDDWQYVESVYDKFGALVAKEIRWDDGTTTDTYFDAHNEYTGWSSYTNSYNSSGQYVGRVSLDDYGYSFDASGSAGLLAALLSFTIFF